MIGDELSHIIKQMANQAQPDPRPFVYGHISVYDPTKHRARCIVPSLTDENGQALLSPWIPMGTLSSGGGFGLQIIPAGGATAQNPTAGEQVLIGLFDRQRGVAAIPCMFFSGAHTPPSESLPQGAPPVAAGDVLLSNNSKTLLRIHPNGDFEIYGTAKLTANVQGDATITTQGNATVQASGTASVIAPVIKLAKAAADALQTLCTRALHDWCITHVHGNSGPPSTAMPANSLTTVVQAE